jgi:thioredoxin-like negative regulator of GroEL
VLAGVWIAAGFRSLKFDEPTAACRRVESTETSDEESLSEEDLFREAQAQYLQGNWYAAEETLRAMLAANPRDVEARLMLATLLRHTARLEEAASQLQQTARLEASAGWRQELQTEWRRLSEAEQDGETRHETEPKTGSVSRAA